LSIVIVVAWAAQTDPRVIAQMLTDLEERESRDLWSTAFLDSQQRSFVQPQVVPSAVATTSAIAEENTVPLRDQVRAALKSGLIPPEVEQDDALLREFAEELLKKLHGFGSDLHGSDGLSAINEARKTCNSTVQFCLTAAELLQKRFVKRCETHCSCRLELTMYPRWVVAYNSTSEVDELRKQQEGIRKNRSLCQGSRVCIYTNDAQFEAKAAQRREIPERLPVLRRRLQEHMRTWESCPLDNSFENCSEAKKHIINARYKLTTAYNATTTLLKSLNCSAVKYVNCSIMKRDEIALLDEERLHNERMLRQVTFLLFDATLARMNVVIYSFLLAASIALISIGVYWDVIRLFKKYTAVIAGMAVVSVLGVIGFTIGGLTGIPRVATYELLLRVR
jgi:hypothetical protein